MRSRPATLPTALCERAGQLGLSRRFFQPFVQRAAGVANPERSEGRDALRTDRFRIP